MKKILITGGSGFIGTNLIFHLVKKNYKVFNIDKISKVSTPEKFKKKINKNYYFFKQNLLNESKLKKTIFKIKPDIILNLAAESHVDRSIDEPKFFIINNISSSLNLFKVLRRYYKYNKKIKIFHFSTDEVYGSNNNKIFSEKSIYNPSSPYAASKGSSDLVANSFFETYNLPMTIFHISNNYGPFQFIEKFIPKIITNYLNDKNIPIYGNGLNIREWLYVKDTCIAIEKAFKSNIKNERYNIGSGKRFKNIFLTKLIIRILKNKFKIKSKSKILYVKDRPGHDFRYAINSKKFYNKVNWKPKKTIVSGLEETISWYLDNKKWLRNSKKKYNGKRQGSV